MFAPLSDHVCSTLPLILPMISTASLSFCVSRTAGSTRPSWSQRTERRKSEAQSSFPTSLKTFYCGNDTICVWSCDLVHVLPYAGWTWLYHSQPRCSFCPWTEGRAWIFSGSSKNQPNASMPMKQITYNRVRVTGTPGTTWCSRGQWISRPGRTTGTKRFTWNICKGKIKTVSCFIMQGNTLILEDKIG